MNTLRRCRFVLAVVLASVVVIQVGTQTSAQSQLKLDALDWVGTADNWYDEQFFPLYRELDDALRGLEGRRVVSGDLLVNRFAEQFREVGPLYFGAMQAYFEDRGIAEQLISATRMSPSRSAVSSLEQAVIATANRNSRAFAILDALSEGDISVTEIRLSFEVIKVWEFVRQLSMDTYFEREALD